MKIFYMPKFKRAIKRCPKGVQATLYRQAEHLLQDLRHPSLRAKKYDEATGVWQTRVNRNYRFYFLIEENTYILLNIRAHPK